MLPSSHSEQKPGQRSLTAHENAVIQGTQQAPGQRRLIAPNALELVRGFIDPDVKVFALLQMGLTQRQIAEQLGFRSHTNVGAALKRLHKKVPAARLLLEEVETAGWEHRDVWRRREERRREMWTRHGVWLYPNKPWACRPTKYRELIPDTARIRRLWGAVEKTESILKVAKRFRIRPPTHIYYILKNRGYVELGAISAETFDRVLAKVAAGRERRGLRLRQLHPPLGLRSVDGKDSPGKGFPRVVRMFQLWGEGKTLDEIVDKVARRPLSVRAHNRLRSHTHKIVRNPRYKPFLDEIDENLWKNAQKPRVRPIDRIREWQRQRRNETMTKLLARLSQGEATAKQLEKTTGLFYTTLLELLKKIIKSGKVTKERRGDHVYYRQTPLKVQAHGRS